MSVHEESVSLIVMLVLLIFSAYFSATETAFTSLSRIRLKSMASSGDKRAKQVLDLEAKYDTLLSTILVGNNIANIANTAVATVFFVDLYGHYGATISTIVVTVVVLIFGEISPKSLAKENPESFAKFSAPFIHALMILFTPINFLFAQWKKLLSFLFKTSTDRGITEDELLTIVEEAETEGNILSDHSELIQNAIEFDELEAQDVLTPRVDIEAIDIEMTEDEIAALFLDTGFSRMPVYEDDLDRILGVLSQKDFYSYVYHKKKTVSEFTKPVVFVAGSMKAFTLLKKMQAKKSKIAIVIDEYGGTAGLVTMEDIIEELVGEIYDEHEEVATDDITPLQDGSYRVMGLANVDKMFDYFGEDEESDANTVNGWVVRIIDKLPEPGDKFYYETEHKIFTGVVTRSDGRTASEINLRVENKPEEEE
ncbi:MAG: HlyC/CorC family transporter [Anaerovoracaceae bacterium]|jgi:putative hemolysin